MISAKPNPRTKTFFYPNMAQAAFASAVSNICANKPGVKIILCETSGECERLYAKMSAFLKMEGCAGDVRILPKLPPREDPDSFEAYCERVGTLNAAASGLDTIVITTPDAILSETPAQAERMELKKGANISMESLRRRLVDFGYYNEVLCEGPGQFAMRGGIVDIYPIASRTPFRIDFFGDEIDSIRPYDPDTQLSDGQSANEIEIDSYTTSAGVKIAADFLNKNPAAWIFLEPLRLAAEYPEQFNVYEKIESPAPNFQKVFDARPGDELIGISSLEEGGGIFKSAQRIAANTEDLSQYRPLPMSESVGEERMKTENELRKNFMGRLLEWSRQGFHLFIEAEGEGERGRIREMFLESGGEPEKCSYIKPFFGEGFIVDFKGAQRILGWGEISKSARGVVCAGSLEMFGRRIKTNMAPRRKMLSRRAEVDALLDFSELCEGDYIVHAAHGICRYQGLTQIETNGAKQEVLKLEFEDNAHLYLPLHKSHLISRYIGLDKRAPKLSRLDSRSWIKVRTAAETAALDYAAELLDIQSRREIAEGYQFPEDGEWQEAFESSFEFVETPDQLRAINEVKADMRSSAPMDRLICADVGFGKTEIAIRAAFKCALAGRQAAILCPTTILCQQHFKTFKERMAAFPIVVEMLSRFRKPKDASRVKEQLASGKIDIIIGTHALLASDVKFKDLGLLVIDEEHRFGVKHKEKIKHLREGIDVLTMSATPIPRTLYFAMMGAKTISIIETPPKNRFPVETIVREYDEDLIKGAVEREVSRQGQVFYLHNRVKTIEATAEKLKKMFPKLRIGVGHGQMNERELEKLMSEFMDGKYDILVCTTIIESGLDIPNCNTIIIEGADKFGLAQLYQLRGRVGRFTRKAYAYMLLHRHAQLVEKAHKRLSAIRQYNKPGAGFRIATRDLQLRGCGNILGAKQSGHIACVGFDMYCSLLKQSIARLKGEKSAAGIRAGVALDFICLGEGGKKSAAIEKASNMFEELKAIQIMNDKVQIAPAYIPEDYIPQAQLRVDIYRRLELCASEEEIGRIKKEMLDRYGKIPQSVEILFYLSQIRIAAEIAGISKVETEGAKLKLRIANPAAVEFVRINGNFPRLTKTNSVGRLEEILNFLKNVYPSIRK
ncbi:MAG: transcription-repair coupling factor [Opitutales bacterium]|nr:transcription-repair coupling factor [Opitutales bacterium]